MGINGPKDCASYFRNSSATWRQIRFFRTGSAIKRRHRRDPISCFCWSMSWSFLSTLCCSCITRWLSSSVSCINRSMVLFLLWTRSSSSFFFHVWNCRSCWLDGVNPRLVHVTARLDGVNLRLYRTPAVLEVLFDHQCCFQDCHSVYVYVAPPFFWNKCWKVLRKTGYILYFLAFILQMMIRKLLSPNFRAGVILPFGREGLFLVCGTVSEPVRRNQN